MSIITPQPPVAPRSSSADTRQPASDAAEARRDPAPQQAPSVTLSLSDYAKKRMASMREATAKLRAMQANRQEERKAAARQRLEDIKKRIALLKQLTAGLGPEAAKGTLRQIKQLAQELGQVASVLKEPSGAAAAGQSNAAAEYMSQEAAETDGALAVEVVSEAAPDGAMTAPDDSSESQQAEAQVRGEQDEHAQPAMQRARTEQDDRQRRADAEELSKVARQLKQLLDMVKAQLNAKPDEDSKKLLDDIGKRLQEVEKAASDMTAGGHSISLGVSLSITV